MGGDEELAVAPVVYHPSPAFHRRSCLLQFPWFLWPGSSF
jgi:hypothetical protein